jgi:hypothetical protein
MTIIGGCISITTAILLNIINMAWLGLEDTNTCY